MRALLICVLFAILTTAVDARAASKTQDPPDPTTPLMRAAEAGRVDEVRRLLESGANPNEKLYSLGLTALMFAAGRGHLDVVKVLLDAGADPNAAGGVVHVGFFSVMIMAMNPQNKNRLEMIDTLLAAGARLNPPNSWPHSPLFTAVNLNDTELIKELLRRGSDVNWEDQIGHTALVIAVTQSERSVEVIRALLSAGADPNKPRIWVGENCVSILSYLDDVPRVPRNRVREEMRELIAKFGGKKYSRKSDIDGCEKK